MDAALETAIREVGGPSALAAKLKITPAAISQWERCPSGRVIAVEAATGVSREKLRPDLYPQKSASVAELPHDAPQHTTGTPSMTDRPFGAPPDGFLPPADQD